MNTYIKTRIKRTQWAGKHSSCRRTNKNIITKIKNEDTRHKRQQNTTDYK